MLDTTSIGPLASSDGIEHMEEICADALSMKGSIIIGGNKNSDGV